MYPNQSINLGISATTPQTTLSGSIWNNLIPKPLIPPQAPTSPVDTTLKGISYNETRGQKDPYSFSQSSGNPQLGRALGKYQITEADLKRLAPHYLPTTPTPEQFLSTPSLQDTFMKNRVQYQLSQGYSPEQIADIHRSGTGGILPPNQYKFKHPEYVAGFKQGIQ